VRLGEGRQALYRTVIEALKEDASLSEQYILLGSAMEILRKIFDDDQPVKLVTSREILPHISPLLKSDHKEYREMARELMARFTTRE
jgi:hypothetical protein